MDAEFYCLECGGYFEADLEEECPECPECGSVYTEKTEQEE